MCEVLLADAVYIASRKQKVVDKVAKELSEMGPGICVALVADLTSKAGCGQLASQIASREPKLHILVNNAGMSWGSSMRDFDEKNGWDRLFALNVKSIWYLTIALVDVLQAASDSNKDPARVINVYKFKSD